MKKLFLFLLVIIISLGCLNGQISRFKKVSTEKIPRKIITKTVSVSVSPSNVVATPKTETISIIGVGDIMLGSNYPSEKYLPGKNILKSVEKITKNAAVTIGNLEGTILDRGGTPKTCQYCFSFRTPDSYAPYLKNAGFDVMGLANNHSCDFGEVGRKNTVKILKENGIQFAGLRKYPYTIFEKNGIKYGFCAFAPNGYSNVMHFNEAKNIIKFLDSKCDIVIVNFHAGAEGPAYQHITKRTEYFLGENRGNPYQLARVAIDNGADIVFMEGPHVPRAIDLYKGRFIAYSLGNFATYGRFNISGPCGISPIIKIFVNRQGEFQKGQIYPIKLVGRGIPIVDKDKTVIKKIINLIESDVPETQLIINDNGIIKKKSK